MNAFAVFLVSDACWKRFLLYRQEKRESQLLIIEEVESCGHRIKVSVSPERKSAPASAKAVGAPDRLSTLLHATDTNTGRVLRCEVFIDSIARLEILTTARSLYRDDLQEVQVQAFDSQGNIFSSVEGLGSSQIYHPRSLLHLSRLAAHLLVDLRSQSLFGAWNLRLLLMLERQS